MKTKLKLDILELKSFVTSIDRKVDINGGIPGSTIAGTTSQITIAIKTTKTLQP